MSSTPARRGPIARALAEAIKAGPVTPADRAAVELAKRYAVAIDADPSPELLDTLGPKLLATLTALGLTVAGRGAKSGSSGPTVPDELAALRTSASKRRAGTNGAAAR